MGIRGGTPRDEAQVAEVQAAAALRAGGARFALVHGSRSTGEKARPDSDLDIAAWWDVDAPDAWTVRVPDGVDLVVLDRAPLWLSGRIAQYGRLLFDDDPPARVRWQADTRLQYLDDRPAVDARYRAFAARLLAREPSVVDADRLLRLLNGIEADVAFLDRCTDTDVATLVADDVLLGSIKYRFITAIEGCAQVAHHIAASEAWPVAESNAGAIRGLGAHTVITREAAEALAAAVGFRNLLVHQYGDVDDTRAVGHLMQLDDLRASVEQVARWLPGR